MAVAKCQPAQSGSMRQCLVSVSMPLSVELHFHLSGTFELFQDSVRRQGFDSPSACGSHHLLSFLFFGSSLSGCALWYGKSGQHAILLLIHVFDVRNTLTRIVSERISWTVSG